MTDFTLREGASLKEIVANHQRKRENMTKVIVVCTGDASARFDRDYYAIDHFKLARACREEYGLQSVEAFFPYSEAGNWKSIGVYAFSSAQGVYDALKSPKHSK